MVSIKIKWDTNIKSLVAPGVSAYYSVAIVIDDLDSDDDRSWDSFLFVK